MNPLLVALSLVGLLGAVLVEGAPAVTSVHVSFVSGNKKTQYSHGTNTRPRVVQYNLESAGTGDDLLLRRLHRSINSAATTPEGDTAAHHHHPTKTRRLRFRRPPGGGSGNILLVSPPTSTQTTTTASGTWTSTLKDRLTTTPTATGDGATKPKRRYRGSPSPLTFAPVPTLTTKAISYSKKGTTTAAMSTTALPPGGKVRFGSRVRFLESSTSPTSSSSTTTSGDTTTDTKTADSTTQTKSGKAVKRSPYIENFESRGITFPDFDEFGGNEFGALRNYIGSGGGGGGGGGGGIAADPGVGVAAHANPESLSPDGVFLPPLPAEANDYSEDGHGGGGGGGGGHSDPYVADPETAKYAAQHPPFFAAFPHKRTVLDLNERRVEQGLEPNILRSIRPFFAFFEAAK